MIDVAIAIDGEAVNVSLTRKAAGDYNADGEFVPGAPSTSTIRAAVQPASGRQLMDLPEGIRNEARWLAWSRSEIRLDDEMTQGGSRYRVMFVWPRAESGFWRAAMGLLA
ncbi:MAG: hypothetical protein J0H34_22405 [Rhizobiales bacterium]|nr:hypothetical protein [Hyphomicrobiales bacterium]